MLPSGEGFIVIDLLGRERTDLVDWLSADETLDDLGIGYLADPYELRLDDGELLRVRLAQVSTDGIVLKQDDGAVNAVGAPQRFLQVGFPASDDLRAAGR